MTDDVDVFEMINEVLRQAVSRRMPFSLSFQKHAQSPANKGAAAAAALRTAESHGGYRRSCGFELLQGRAGRRGQGRTARSAERLPELPSGAGLHPTPTLQDLREHVRLCLTKGGASEQVQPVPISLPETMMLADDCIAFPLQFNYYADGTGYNKTTRQVLLIVCIFNSSL